MDIYLRFRDLKERGIVNNRPSLRHRIRNFGFPPGRLIGPNTRAWTEAEVEAWLASQPTAPKPAPGRPPKISTGNDLTSRPEVA